MRAYNNSSIRGTCDLCGEEIEWDEPCYEMPDGDLICEECVLEWAAQYKTLGVTDLV